MLRIPALAIQGAAVALSAAAHAAVLVAVGGHGTSPVTLLDERAAEVDVTLDRPVEPVDDDHDHPINPAAPSAASHPHTHTHPYPVPPSHDATPHDPSLVHVFGAAPAPASTAQAEPAAPPATTPAEEALPRFTVAIGPAVPAGPAAAGSFGGHGSGSGDDHADGPPVPEHSVSVPARLQQGVTPAYPPAARSEGVEADVPMELVVSRTGAVESARVLQHAGLGFDEAALDAIRRYRFTPAVHDGRPTRVVMRWTMQFRLR